MITISQQQWNERFKTLPEEIRGVLMSYDNQLADRVLVIAERHKIDDAQAQSLTRITAYLLMGFILPAQFVGSIMEELGVSRENAVLLAQDINRDIFNSVKDALTQVHTVKTRPGSVPPTPAGSTPAPVVTPPTPSPAGSIFEQKLGGTFRMAAGAGTGKVPDPMLIVPPPPQPTNPLLRTTPPGAASPTAQKVDPYREAA